MKREAAYNKGIAQAGGLTKLAELMGESPQTLINWRKRGVPPGKCRAFSAATGMSLIALRPNDWAAYWPQSEAVASTRIAVAGA
jgi:DNA-binding transcriptional regulator YdaS (Cro superfamily)